MIYGKIKINEDSVYIENTNGDIKFVDNSNPSGILLSDIEQSPAEHAPFILEFTSSNLVGDVLTVNHNLNTKYIILEVYNNLDQKIIPDSITLIDDNSFEIDFSSYVVTGTYRVVIPLLASNSYTKQEQNEIMDGYVSFESRRANYHDTTYSPVALYQFNGNMNDSSGNGYNLSRLYGTEQYMTLKNGLTGFYFDNSTLIRSNIVPALQIVGDCTWEVVISPLPFTNTNPLYINLGEWGESINANVLYGTYLITNGAYLNVRGFWEYGSGTNVFIITTVNLKVYDIYHIAMVRSGSSPNVKLDLFINGIKIYTATGLTAPQGGSLSRLCFGGAENGGSITNSFCGVISSAKIIPSALTDEQVLSEYRRTLGGGNVIQSTEFEPTDIMNNVVWLRSDLGLYQDSAGTIPVTTNSDPVKCWKDQSATGSFYTTSLSGFSWVDSLISANNKPAVNFNSTAWNSGFSSTNFYFLSKPCTIFAVWSSSKSTTTAYERVINGSNWAMVLRYSPNGICTWGGSGFTGSVSYVANNVVMQMTEIFSSSSRQWVNGVQTAGDATGTSEPGRIWIGGGENNENLIGNVFEVIAYNRQLTSDERIRVQNYLGARYGISVP